MSEVTLLLNDTGEAEVVARVIERSRKKHAIKIDESEPGGKKSEHKPKSKSQVARLKKNQLNKVVSGQNTEVSALS